MPLVRGRDCSFRMTGHRAGGAGPPAAAHGEELAACEGPVGPRALRKGDCQEEQGTREAVYYTGPRRLS